MKQMFVLIVAGILSTYAIKAQVANGPPTVTCPAASTVACGSLANVSADVADPDGDALTVVWSVNGVAVQTNDVPASTNSTSVSFSANLSLGTNTLSVTAGGVEVERWNTVASGVNYLNITPGATGSGVTIGAAGSDTDIGITLTPKGAVWRNNGGSFTDANHWRSYAQTARRTVGQRKRTYLYDYDPGQRRIRKYCPEDCHRHRAPRSRQEALNRWSSAEHFTGAFGPPF